MKAVSSSVGRINGEFGWNKSGAVKYIEDFDFLSKGIGIYLSTVLFELAEHTKARDLLKDTFQQPLRAH